MVGLCFSVLTRFLLSLRFTGGGAPIAARAMAFTALVARNGLGFFFFGTVQEFNRKGREGRNGLQHVSVSSWLIYPMLPRNGFG